MPTRWKLAGVAGLAALGLAGCSNEAGNGRLPLAGVQYCAPFKSAQSGAATPAALNSGDPAQVFEDCVHRWGYTLAPARDPADLVAQAAVDACGPLLTAWNQQTAAQQPGQTSSSPSSSAGGPDAQNPGPPSAVEQRMQMVEARALFYVVQARAAGCAAPPAKTLYSAATPPGG